ncbi:MAG TPA: hypothetical protein VHP34_06350 [Alphaproteobacteria bacterium]|nr:hypothetical protein [Alphaproteobacteria bacterium]
MATAQEKTAVDIREACSLRLGEMIEAVIGDSRLKDIYTAQEKYPHDTGGLSAGEMALKSGIISADTKTALLIAQAAERTLRLADKTEHFIDNVEKINQDAEDQAAKAKSRKEREIAAELKLQDKRTFLQKAFGLYSAPGMTFAQRTAIKSAGEDAVIQAQKDLGRVSLKDNPQFKFLGSEGDHDLLKAAQATNLVAQMYLNNEMDNKFALKIFPFEQGVSSAGADFVNGLRREAAKFFNDAALLMIKEGHFEAADAMRKVGKDIAKDVEHSNAPAPAQLLTKMLDEEKSAVKNSNDALSQWSSFTTIRHRYGFEPEQQDKIGGLLALADQARKSLLEAAVDNDVATHKQTRTMKPIQLKNGG